MYCTVPTAVLHPVFVCHAVFATLFLAVALYNRLDFTITKDECWQEDQARDKARGILQKLLTIWERESGQGVVLRVDGGVWWAPMQAAGWETLELGLERENTIRTRHAAFCRSC